MKLLLRALENQVALHLPPQRVLGCVAKQQHQSARLGLVLDATHDFKEKRIEHVGNEQGNRAAGCLTLRRIIQRMLIP